MNDNDQFLHDIFPVSSSINEPYKEMTMEESLKAIEDYVDELKNKNLYIIFRTQKGSKIIDYDAENRTLSAPLPEMGTLFLIPKGKSEIIFKAIAPDEIKEESK